MGKPGGTTGRAGKKKPEEREVRNRKLRAEAENKVARSAGKTPPLKEQDLDKLVHELEVHQVELEMQNDELLRSQAELESAKETYFELYDLAPVGYFSISEKGVILEANLTGANMLGMVPHDLRAKIFSSLIYKEDRDIYYLHRQKLFETQTPQACEMRMVRRDGPLIWALIEATLARDGRSGKPICHATMSDITEIKQAGDDLLTSEVRFQNISAITSDIAYSCITGEDGSYSIDWITGAAERITGYSCEEIKAQGCWRFLVVEQDQSLFEQNVTGLTPGTQSSCQLRISHKNGGTVWIASSAKCVQDPKSAGRLLLYGGLADISAAKRAEGRIRESEKQYRLLAEHTTDFIWMMDMDLKPVYQSPSAEKLTGFTHDELVELPFEKRVTPESLKLASEIFLGELPRVLTEPAYNPVHKIDLEIYRKDGSTLWSENKFSVIRDENGRPISILGEARDITQRKLDEEKLVKSYEATKKALDDAINTMVKIVELRDPYTAGHQQKVAGLATAIAGEMKLEDARIEQLRTAALIHDIGKMYIPSDILSKPGKLSEIELGLIKTHSKSGYDIVKGMDFPAAVALAVLQHHERLDGSGYPSQLKGADTLLEAKILAVADVVEAMASHRPYRPALGVDKALEELSNGKGKLYDPDVVDTCIELLNSGKFAF